MTIVHGNGRAAVMFAGIAAAACLLFAPPPAHAVVSSQVNGGGQLFVSGDGASDSYAISCVAGTVKVNGADPSGGPTACAAITLLGGNTGPGDDTVDLTAVSNAAGFTNPRMQNTPFGTYIALGEGADVGVLGPLGGEFEGEGGNDQLTGSDNRDRFGGGPGSDTIHGRGGFDLVNSGSGNDRVFGEGGRDNLNGQGGADLMAGGAGGDLLYGNGGNDALLGGGGRDTAHGDRGRDRCRAELLFNCET